MNLRRSPTIGLLAGLVVTLSAVTIYSGYTIVQLHRLRELQAEIIDRNRTDSLLLLRIQNNLNSLNLAMRDMLDASDPYPLMAWAPQFRRIRTDLEDALSREEKLLSTDGSSNQRQFLGDSFAEFWRATDRTFALANEGQERESRAQIRFSLQARQDALTTAVARLLVRNNESEQEAATRTRELYGGVERNVYIFMAAMLVLIALTSLYLMQYNRRLFAQVATLSERRSELAQQLISMQENTFRSISRELHDDFGQILISIGAMLRLAGRRASGEASPLIEQLDEVRGIVQATLEKIRSLSHALHPVVLDEAGLESALNAYLPSFQKQTGIEIRYEKMGVSRDLDRGVSIHLYRVLQEALNNVVRHSKSTCAAVRLEYLQASIVLEVEDNGIGFPRVEGRGMGLVSMRERAELIDARIEFLPGAAGGALVRVTAPITPEEAHAGA